MKYSIIILTTMALTACSGKRLANRCADNFPCGEQVSVRTDTLVATDTIEYGEVYVYMDTTECPAAEEAKTIVKTITQPGQPRLVVKTLTVRRDSIIKVRDMAAERVKLDSLQHLVEVANTDKRVEVANLDKRVKQSWSRGWASGLVQGAGLALLLLGVVWAFWMVKKRKS